MSDKKVHISFRIPAEEKKFLQDYAKRNFRTQTELFREFLRRLEDEEAEKGKTKP